MTSKEPTEGERLRIAMTDATFTRRRSGDNSEPWAHEWQTAATEFSRPYRERIAELEKRLAEQDAEREKLVSDKRRAEARVRAWEERTGESGPSAPRIVGAKLESVTVDGKTPGQVFAAEFLVGGSDAVRMTKD